MSNLPRETARVRSLDVRAALIDHLLKDHRKLAPSGELGAIFAFHGRLPHPQNQTAPPKR